MKIDADEKELLESVERGEWKSAGGGKRERPRYSRYATAEVLSSFSRSSPEALGSGPESRLFESKFPRLHRCGLTGRVGYVDSARG